MVTESPTRRSAATSARLRKLGEALRMDEGQVGLARLVRVGPTVFRLEWQGPDGSGRGLIGPAGPVDFQFPSPLPISGPPALPHLSGGAFDFKGDPEQPESFTITYV